MKGFDLLMFKSLRERILQLNEEADALNMIDELNDEDTGSLEEGITKTFSVNSSNVKTAITRAIENDIKPLAKKNGYVPLSAKEFKEKVNMMPNGTKFVISGYHVTVGKTAKNNVMLAMAWVKNKESGIAASLNIPYRKYLKMNGELKEDKDFVSEDIVTLSSNKNIIPAVTKALKDTNEKARSKGYTPVKSYDELKGFKDNIMAAGTNMDELRQITRFHSMKPKVIKGQLILFSEGTATTSAVTAVFRNKDGKVRGLRVDFHRFLKVSGGLREDD